MRLNEAMPTGSLEITETRVHVAKKPWTRPTLVLALARHVTETGVVGSGADYGVYS